MITAIMFIGILVLVTLISATITPLRSITTFLCLTFLGSLAAFFEGSYSLNAGYITIILSFTLTLFASAIFASGTRIKILIPVLSGQKYIIRLLNKIFAITSLLAVIIIVYSMNLLSSDFLYNIFKFRMAQINNVTSEYPGLLSNTVVYSYVKNSILFCAIAFINSVAVLEEKRAAIFFLVLLVIMNFILGSRWTSMYFVLSYIMITGRDMPYISLRNAVILITISFMFFVGGYIRSLAGGLEISFWELPYKYTFANFAAFDILVEKNLYIPETFRYISYLLFGTTNSIVADNVTLEQSGVRTNTFTIFGQFSEYLTNFGGIVYAACLGFLLIYCNKTYAVNVISRIIYVLIAPAVLLFIFTEPVFPQLALMLRFVIISLPVFFIGYFLTVSKQT